jgi:fructoselysine and glucoselysine-specific PTS system IID component
MEGTSMNFNIHSNYDKRITKKDLIKVFWRSIPLEHSWNYERMANVGFCFALYPILKKLYPEKKDLSQAMKRNLTLYNITPYISSFPLGITAALEETNAMDEEFNPETVGNVKTALMGPISGIGDSFFHGTLRAIATGIGCSLAIKGNLLGPLLFFLIFNIPHYTLRYIGTFLGYKLGSESIQKMIASGFMESVTEAASIVGMMVVGAMTMEMSGINFATTIGVDAGATTMQSLLEGIVPGFPTMILFGFTYFLLKKKLNPLLIMLIILVIAIAGAFFGFLA